MTDKLNELFSLQSSLDNRIISERNIDKSLDEWVVGVTYVVEEIDGLAKEHDVLGQILYDDLKIKLDANIPQDRKEETLIHEITHGIFHEAGYEEQDEDMINRVGKVLYQVIKGNPNLLAVVR